MNQSTQNISEILEKIRSNLSSKDNAREKVLRRCRESIRYSASAIRSVHRGEYDEARTSINTAGSILKEVCEILSLHKELMAAGFCHDSQKEYAEGSITLAVVIGDHLPDPDELGVSYAAYLNGMGEAVGELRRHLLDIIRKGDISRGEEVLEIMDDMYNAIVTLDFPDALTYGLKRTADVVRSILEKTRSDLTMAISARDLKDKMEKLSNSLQR